MTRIFLILFAALMPGVALAKRAAPTPVDPVIYQGVRYVAPTGDGIRAFIEAWDVQSNKKLWDLIVFTNRFDPTLEEDVQAIYIKTLSIHNGKLLVISEHGNVYRVDLTSRTVVPTDTPGTTARIIAAVISILVIGVVILVWRRANRS